MHEGACFLRPVDCMACSVLCGYFREILFT
jgi:hypothetical protein